jgi:hypothetical protein
MKKALISACCWLTTLNAAASCAITSVYNTDFSRIFTRYGGWNTQNGLSAQKYNAACEKLQRANARLQIDGNATVLGNQAIAWVIVSVKDANTAIGSTDFNAHVTKIDGSASQDKAEALMITATNEALQNWDQLDQALAVLEREREQAKK